ncbi:MAG: glycosyltransferase family 4 protein [Planctomycetota bacterium]
MTEPAQPGGRPPRSFAFLLGDARISGGTNVILEHALGLREAGHRVVLVTPRPVADSDLAWKAQAAGLPRGTTAALRGERFDLALATWWRSAYDLAELDASACAYFVQSIESRFFADEHPRRQALARASYSLHIPVITEASWIASHLRSLYGRDAAVVRNGIDKAAFRTDGQALSPRLTRGLRVLVEGPLGVAYKRVELAIRLCQRAGVEEVWLMTSSDCGAYPGVDRVLSRVPPTSVGDVMRSCDLILKLSTVEGMFGPPLEMMHCGGTAITSDVSGHEEFMRHGENGLVVPCGEELEAVDLLRRLSRDREHLRSLRAGATSTARDWPTWGESSRAMVAQLERLAEDRSTPSTEQVRAEIARAARVEPRSGRGFWPLLRRHFRAFTRTRLPALAAQFDRDERSPRSRHAVAPLPHVDLPRFVRPRRPLRLVVIDDSEPLADHLPHSSADLQIVRQAPAAPLAAADIVLTFSGTVADRVAAIGDGPFTILMALESPRGAYATAAHGVVVADLLDALDLRQRGVAVLATWIPPVRDDFFLADSCSKAWQRRPHDILWLVDDPAARPGRERSLPLNSGIDTLRAALADVRAVMLPRQTARPRLAAARALLAMASGCLVASPRLALQYGALSGEHFIAPEPPDRLRSELDHPDLEVVRMNGRGLATRHAASTRLQRLIASISTRERSIPGRMLANRRSP